MSTEGRSQSLNFPSGAGDAQNHLTPATTASREPPEHGYAADEDGLGSDNEDDSDSASSESESSEGEAYSGNDDESDGEIAEDIQTNTEAGTYHAIAKTQIPMGLRKLRPALPTGEGSDADTILDRESDIKDPGSDTTQTGKKGLKKKHLNDISLHVNGQMHELREWRSSKERVSARDELALEDNISSPRTEKLHDERAGGAGPSQIRADLKAKLSHTASLAEARSLISGPEVPSISVAAYPTGEHEPSNPPPATPRPSYIQRRPVPQINHARSLLAGPLGPRSRPFSKHRHKFNRKAPFHYGKLGETSKLQSMALKSLVRLRCHQDSSLILVMIL